MIPVLHGTWLPTKERFFFWGEASEPSSRRGGRAQTPQHPSSLPFSDLYEYLTVLKTSVPIPPERTLTIWLPSADNAPLPLREQQAAGAPVPAGEVQLAPWRVRGLLLEPLQMIEALLALGNRREAGADLQAWRIAALLAMEIVTSQQMIPALAKTNKGLDAVWQPRPTPDTARKIAALARSLPPLCRAVSDDAAAAPPPRGLVDAFLAASVDALARRFGTAPLQQIRTRQRTYYYATTRAEAWLTALLSPEPQVALQPRAADELYAAWQAWANQEHVAGDEHFRITFRLESPEREQDPWALSYLLQATDDPSLIVPATHLWRERGQHFQYLDRRFAHPHERLLRGLGFAARLCPPIERSLHQKAPDHAALGLEEAFTFLNEVAPLLEQSGFGVLVPAWWRETGRIHARMRAGEKRKRKTKDGSGFFSFASMINFDWELSIGDQPLDQEELERLVKLKQPLVQVRGQWVALDPTQMQRAMALFKRGGEMTVGEALRLGLSGEAPQLPGGVTYAGMQAEGAFGEMLQGLSGNKKLKNVPQPPEFAGQLRPYQQRGLDWLAFMRSIGLGACLADDMGLGKTAQTIALMLHDRAKNQAPGATLLVCPTSVVGNWQRELNRFAPALRVYIHQGAERTRDEELADVAANHDVVITSYPLLARDRAILTPITWHSVVLDEAQNIKNSETQQAQAARALTSGHRLALTGTPVENRLTELWSIMAFLNPGYLGSESEFRRTIARPIERAGDTAAAERLRRLTGPFILRRLKTDRSIITDLPNKYEMKEFVPLTKEQVTLYEAAVRDALSQIEQADDSGEDTRRRGLVLAMLTRLKQICNHPAHFLQDGSKLAGRSGKLARLDEMLEEVLAADDRALIFTQFAEMGHLLQQHLSAQFGSEALFLHGGVPAKKRDLMVREFQSANGPNLFILSLKAGGVGLNLTRAGHVFHFDRWWNPAVEDQATDRAFRIGQTQHVQVHAFVTSGTLEEQIDKMIEGKRALAAQVLSSGEGWLTELSTDKLRELVTLRPTALIAAEEEEAYAA